MPWLEPQARLLRTLGIHWARKADPIPHPPGTHDLGGGALSEVDGVGSSPSTGRQSPFAPRSVAAAVEPGAAADSGQVCETAMSVTGGPSAPLDWIELRAAVAACEACDLCRTRKQTVFGVGSTQAHWMVLGEAPGEQEDLWGEPFVGAAGRLLDQMLGALGLSRREELSRRDTGAVTADQGGRRQVYIANTLKCRPPGNRNPQPEEMARCEPFLERQLQLLQPRIILAMGRFAVQSLLRSAEPVGKLRGRVHVYRGVPLIVTYHPAYLLRNPADKARAWEDLCLAAATFEALEAGAPLTADAPR